VDQIHPSKWLIHNCTIALIFSFGRETLPAKLPYSAINRLLTPRAAT
jgi:hypothetical protein